MNKIRSWLYLGTYRETLNLHLLSARNIGAMLQLADLIEHAGITSLYLPVNDGEPLAPDLLRTGVDFVIDQKQQGQTVLIACGAGVSRSAAYAVAVLKEVEALSLLEALRVVRQKHSAAMPHPALWEALCTYYDEEASLKEVFKRR